MQFIIRHRLLVAIIGSSLVLLAITAVGLYGLLRGPEPTPQPEALRHPWPGSTLPPILENQLNSGQPHAIVQTPDAELFVRAVAGSLFDWDTRNTDGPSDWAQPLVDVAAPDEAPAVAADVRSYIPSEEMWNRLSTYGTRQRLEISAIAIPETWPAALAQATPGQIPDSAAAYTVTGTRHRIGSWGAEPVYSEQPVAFTVFVVCPPADKCTLLRLSQLGNPLK